MKPTLILGLVTLLPLLVNATWDRPCQTGPGVQLRLDSKEGARCAWQDLDHDGDIDQSDFGLWQADTGKVVVVFVVDLSVASMSDPERCVRDELNKREAQRR